MTTSPAVVSKRTVVTSVSAGAPCLPCRATARAALPRRGRRARGRRRARRGRVRRRLHRSAGSRRAATQDGRKRQRERHLHEQSLPVDEATLPRADCARQSRLGYCPGRSAGGGSRCNSGAATLSRADWRLILLASLGGALEFYDFVIYSQFARYIGRNFFPNDDEMVSLIVSFSVFAVGYFARPLGRHLLQPHRRPHRPAPRADHHDPRDVGRDGRHRPAADLRAVGHHGVDPARAAAHRAGLLPGRRAAGRDLVRRRDGAAPLGILRRHRLLLREHGRRARGAA